MPELVLNQKQVGAGTRRSRTRSQAERPSSGWDESRPFTTIRLRCGSGMRCRLLDLPAPDQQPKHKDQFPEERDEEESKMGVWIKVWLQAIDHPAQSIDYQQNPDYPWDVAGPVNQVAQ